MYILRKEGSGCVVILDYGLWFMYMYNIFVGMVPFTSGGFSREDSL